MAYGYNTAQEFINKPSHALGCGLIVAVLGLYLSIMFWNDLQKLPTQPELIDISQISEAHQSKTVEPFWVSLQNSRWDCDSIHYTSSGKDTKTEIIATDPEERIIVLVDFSDKLTCEEIVQNNPMGFLRQWSDRRYKIVTESGNFNLSKYPEADQYFDICAYCGRGNTRAGIAFGILLLIGGLSLYPLSRREHNKRFSRMKRYVPRKSA